MLLLGREQLKQSQNQSRNLLVSCGSRTKLSSAGKGLWGTVEHSGGWQGAGTADGEVPRLAELCSVLLVTSAINLN